MPFRLWLYLNALALVSFGTAGLGLVMALDGVFRASMWVLVPLCLTGAGMALYMLFGRIAMTCPFCKHYGIFGADKSLGPFLECSRCGVVHGTGPLWLRLTRDTGSGSGHDVARSDSDLTHP